MTGVLGGPGASESSQMNASAIAVTSATLLVATSAPNHRSSHLSKETGPNNSKSGRALSRG